MRHARFAVRERRDEAYDPHEGFGVIGLIAAVLALYAIAWVL